MKKLLLLLLLGIMSVTGWAPHAEAAPAAPQMTYTVNGLNVTVSWTAVPGATGYTLHYAPYGQ